MLYIFNSDEELLTVLSNASGRAPALWDAIHKENLAGENSFSFTVPADNEAAQYVTEGNLVAWKDLDGVWQMFEIKRKIDDHGDKLTRYVECEHVAYELLDEFSLLFTSGKTITIIPGPDTSTITVTTPILITATQALTALLAGTRWSVGTVTVTGSHSFEYLDSNVYSLLKTTAGLWTGEVQFRMDIVNGIITGRYVDLLVERGQDRGKQFVYGKDVKDIERDIDLGGVCTALYGKGKEGINFSAVVWTTPTDPVNKPAGQQWVGDPAALSQWGRAGGTRHRYSSFENTAQDLAANLLVETWNELQKKKVPRTSYVLKVAILETSPGYVDEKTRIGDTVRGIDRAFNPPLLCKVRVVEVVRNLLELEDTEVTLGTYKPSIIIDLAEQRQQNAATTIIAVETAAVVDTVIAPDPGNPDMMYIGTNNGLGTCHFNTAIDGIRIQSHVPGNYMKVEDDGGLSFYSTMGGTERCYGTIRPDGTGTIGAGGGSPPAAGIGVAYPIDDSGVNITRDGVAENWTWTKTPLGKIATMTSNLGRTITVTY